MTSGLDGNSNQTVPLEVCFKDCEGLLPDLLLLSMNHIVNYIHMSQWMQESSICGVLPEISLDDPRYEAISKCDGFDLQAFVVLDLSRDLGSAI